MDADLRDTRRLGAALRFEADLRDTRRLRRLEPAADLRLGAAFLADLRELRRLRAPPKILGIILDQFSGMYIIRNKKNK